MPVSPSASSPLAGITVLDMTRVLAGPYCTMILADLGARVIKVEKPDGGDDARNIGPFIKGRSAYFMSLNRGKESIALDLRKHDDRIIFEGLLDQSDILVENFRPGVMQRLGYGWDCLHQRYPRLIYAAISGFGQNGPYRDRPAYDLIAQAMGGLMSLTGHPGTPPTRAGVSIGDMAAGLFATIGILSTLYRREETGCGDMVDVAMLDCQVALLENALVRLGAGESPPQPLGARHPSITPFDCFAACDGYLVIACGNDKLFALLCQVLERPELATDPRYRDNAARTRHADQLKKDIEATLLTRPRDHWLSQCLAVGVPCGPIQDAKDVLDDPQVRARNMIVTPDDPETGSIRMAGNPIKLASRPDPEKRPPSPELDQHGPNIRATIDKTNQPSPSSSQASRKPTRQT